MGKLIHGQKRYHCTYCQKGFGKEGALTAHIKVVHEKNFPCEKCGKFYGTNSELEKHKRESCKFSEIRVKCNDCHMIFKSEERLCTHRKHAHDKTRPYECSTCLQNFKSKERLEHHIERIHNLRNVENCPYCRKPYSRLKVHVETCNSGPDAGKKRFFCSFCDKAFIYRDSLSR